ncbi:hypothetical protein [Streptomyces sp. Je 1-369]|uniref:hypothetical protein n=1 Tax=Streptomyces sp. Je 1-369 TaxID=2966192 RepID=UPI0022866C11|nr:hypothetical protein [Streptomyces sp. Je 1-369]WAL98765.1 hypothetical protein NOO62_32385 [Streptomyces sp. Je 1-369]
MIKQVAGRKKEIDGIVLRNETLRAEGRREKQRGREELRALRSTGDQPVSCATGPYLPERAPE